MNQPETTSFESVSLALNQFRERRLADRRFSARDSNDRRMLPGESPLGADGEAAMHAKHDGEAAREQNKPASVVFPEAN
ncbi:MAG: hypothetical protein ACRYGK_15880 [Janthinobacterium lividum]